MYFKECNWPRALKIIAWHTIFHNWQIPDRRVFGHYVFPPNRSFAKYIMSNDSVNIDIYTLTYMNRKEIMSSLILNVCAHYVVCCTTYSFDLMLFDLLITTRLVTNSLSSQELALINF